ncbi:MAG: hypothetical protein K2Y05_00455, partial [Hyphomicrobiaceae bacterium]|nr:hypothetical protein [Hyphomicrobiaceae bacterium]
VSCGEPLAAPDNSRKHIVLPTDWRDYMFGGLLKSTSLAALVAVAGFAAAGSANAADLGGNCCADLEERIAELEATTARKGNRKVSLTVSGFVNEQVMVWDDGVETNAYQVTSETARTRFRFVGNAKIDANWSAGYLLEIGVRGARQDQVSQNNDDAAQGLDLRHSAWWIQNKDLGRVWVGQTSASTDGITEINLANVGHFNTIQLLDYTGGFLLRRSGTGTLSTITVNNITSGKANPGEGTRFNVVKYDTPTIMGFAASASWGEDDLWEVALRYAGEFNGIKLAAGIGYAEWTDGNNSATSPGVGENGCTKGGVGVAAGRDVDCNDLGMSASIMHVPTGLFLTGAYGQREDNNRVVLGIAGNKKRDEIYQVMGGIEQKFFPLGKTTLYGEYIEGEYGANAVRSAASLGLGGQNIANADITVWGIGFNQQIDAAAMDLYVMYRNYEFDVKSNLGNKALLEDFQTVVMGGRIQF